jgi:hypothetical protein
MAEIFNLYFYIDAKLLKSPKLANLCFQRMVAGEANVIFQRKTPADFTHRNKFSWTQSYAIGATETAFYEGAFVSNV